MSFRQSIAAATFHSLSLVLASLGGVLGVVWTLTIGGLISIPVGIALGVFVALAIAYHNVRTERDALRKGKPDVVRALIPLLKYATGPLYNRVKDSTDTEAITLWKTEIGNWVSEAEEVMLRVGCTEDEVFAFDSFTVADLQNFGELHPTNPTINQRRQRIQFNIVHLRKIINRYSDHPVFIE